MEVVRPGPWKDDRYGACCALLLTGSARLRGVTAYCENETRKVLFLGLL